MFEYSVLIFGVVAVLAVMWYSQVDALSPAEVKRLIAMAHADARNALRLADNCIDKIADMDRELKSVAGVVKNLKTEIEILTVRQRSLDKKIISSERTVNFYFKNPVPMQVVGRGKKALIP